MHALPVHGPAPFIGRETLVRLVERWALRCGGSLDDVILVFDGPCPRGGLARQLASVRLHVQFSAPATADDVVVELIRTATHPDNLRVVSGDSAILHEARRRRCPCTDSATFSRELFAAPPTSQVPDNALPEKPEAVSKSEVDEWLDAFGMHGDDGNSDQHDWQAF